MTAPTPEKIQRWEPDLKYIGTGDYVPVLSKSDYGDAVMYEDHIRHLKLAQIEILESLINRFAVRSCACSIQMEAEVAALRKEIEG